MNTAARNAVLAPIPHLARAARGVRIQFFVSGALFATWGVQVPAIKAHYGLGEQALAVAMLAAGLGSLGALSQAGRVVGRFGPRRVSALTGLLCSLLLAALMAPQTYALLLILMLAFGICFSLFDVAVNAEASEIERLSGRSLMSGFHGMFSLGGMCGAALGSAVQQGGFTPQQHLLMAAALALPAVLLGSASMLPVEPAADGGQQGHSLPHGPLVLIGVLAALGLLAEGAIYDWSVLFMKQDRASDIGTAALAYAGFSAAMAVGRFGGDWVRSHLTPVAVLRVSGLLAASGMGLTLALPQPGAGLLGFVLVGFGLSNVVPVLYSAASRVPGISPAHGIAAVSSVGYLGMMAGPPLIGMVAQHASLSLGLVTVVIFALFMAAAASRALSRVGR